MKNVTMNTGMKMPFETILHPSDVCPKKSEWEVGNAEEVLLFLQEMCLEISY